MAKRRRTSSKAKAASVRVKRWSASSNMRRGFASRAVGRFVLPLLIISILLVGLVFLGISGYRTATVSDFFALRNVEIRGTERTSDENIQRIVSAAVEKTGVWMADLGEIREKIEKFPFVKSAAVSRMLPAGIRVNVTERVPAAVVLLNNGNYLVDTEGTILTAVSTTEKDFPFVLKGWDEAKTEKAIPDNLARLKIYQKMLDDWKQFDIAKRVKEVNLSNAREPVAVVEDSGNAVAITLAKDNFGKGLKMAIDALSGKGARVKSIDAGGVYPVIQYIEF